MLTKYVDGSIFHALKQKHKKKETTMATSAREDYLTSWGKTSHRDTISTTKIAPATCIYLEKNLKVLQKNDKNIRLKGHKETLSFTRTNNPVTGSYNFSFIYSGDIQVDVNHLINEMVFYKEHFKSATLAAYVQSRYGLLASQFPFREVTTNKNPAEIVLMLLGLRRKQSNSVSTFFATTAERFAPLHTTKKDMHPPAYLHQQSFEQSFGEIATIDMAYNTVHATDIQELRYRSTLPKRGYIYNNLEALSNLTFSNYTLEQLESSTTYNDIVTELAPEHRSTVLSYKKFKNTYMLDMPGVHQGLQAFIKGGSTQAIPDEVINPEIHKVMTYMAFFMHQVSKNTKISNNPEPYTSVNYRVASVLEECRGAVNLNNFDKVDAVKAMFTKAVSEKKDNFFSVVIDPFMERNFAKSNGMRLLSSYRPNLISNYAPQGIPASKAASLQVDGRWAIDFELTRSFEDYDNIIRGTAREALVSELKAYPRDVWSKHLVILQNTLKRYGNCDADSKFEDTLLGKSPEYYKMQIILVQIAINSLFEISLYTEYKAYLLRSTLEASRMHITNPNLLFSKLHLASQALVSLAYTKRNSCSNSKIKQSTLYSKKRAEFKTIWGKNVSRSVRSSIDNVMTINWSAAKHRLDTAYPMYFATLTSKSLSIVAAHHDCAENRVGEDLLEKQNIVGFSEKIPNAEYMTNIVMPNKDGRMGEYFGLYASKQRMHKETNLVSSNYFQWFQDKHKIVNSTGIRKASTTISDMTYLQLNVRLTSEYGDIEKVKKAKITRDYRNALKKQITEETPVYLMLKTRLENAIAVGCTSEDVVVIRKDFEESRDKLKGYQQKLHGAAADSKEERAKIYVKNTHVYANAMTEIMYNTTNYAFRKLDPRFMEAVDTNFVAPDLADLCSNAVRSIYMPEIIRMQAELVEQYGAKNNDIIIDKLFKYADGIRAQVAQVMVSLITAMPAIDEDPVQVLEAVSLEGALATSGHVEKLLAPVTIEPRNYVTRIASLASLATNNNAESYRDILTSLESILSRKYFAGMGSAVTGETVSSYSLNDLTQFSVALTSVESNLSLNIR